MSLPYFQLHFARQREKELIEQARIARLLADTEADKPGYRARFIKKSGAILILIGQKLQESYETETQLAQQQTSTPRVLGR